MNLSESHRQVLFDLTRVLVTLSILALATGGVYWVTQQHKAHPWTRDGQVLAQVVHIAPQVSGPVIRIMVSDNQLVQQGDLLFEIDPTLYEQAVQQAEADLAQAKAEAKDAAADLARATALKARGDLSQQNFDLKNAQAESTAAAVASATVALETARIKLGYTRISAPTAGYVTNLELDSGTYAEAGEPLLALIDANSFWVAAYFKETDLASIAIGDPAVVTLMSHPDQPLSGQVKSIAFGIARRNNSPALGDLAEVAPTFEWIRLAQRIPVRIALDGRPAVPLRVGYSASVAINPARGGNHP